MLSGSTVELNLAYLCIYNYLFFANLSFFCGPSLNLWCKRNVGLSSVRRFTHIRLMISMLMQAICFVRRVVIGAKANSSSPASLHLCSPVYDCNLHLGHTEKGGAPVAGSQQKYWHVRCLFWCKEEAVSWLLTHTDICLWYLKADYFISIYESNMVPAVCFKWTFCAYTGVLRIRLFW